ncbi:MAG: hypothetical protein ABI193_02515 [Minicystis sp.]
MRKAEIDALVHAHRGRARPVAFFHVLRQPALEPDDHAFLLEHVAELGASDLIRWRVRCEPGFTGPVIRQLARRAIADPRSFQHEVLDLPRIELASEEWIELASLVRNKVPPAVYDQVVARGGARPERPPAEFFFTPGVLDRNHPLLDDTDGAALDAARTAAAQGLDALPIEDILLARRKGRLDLDDAALTALAMERALASRGDWSAATPDLPPILREAVLEKARRTESGGERANLLNWLSAQSVPRTTLFPIALAAVHEGQVSYGLVGFLAGQLGTRAAWDKHGLQTLSALMAQRAFPEIGELITVAFCDASRDKASPPLRLLEAIQGAFALSLLEIIEEALTARDEGRALCALSALACLDPPSRVSRAVHDLRRIEAVSPEISALIGVNERLVKHSDARDASLEGVIAALHAIADAFG